MEDAKQKTFSRAEYSAMSIQDRIRAMNNTLQDDDGLTVDALNSPAVPPTLPTTPRESSAATEEVADEELASPKRSSVVDMWRKREGSINRGAAAGRASPVIGTAAGRASPVTGMTAGKASPVIGTTAGRASPVTGTTAGRASPVIGTAPRKLQARAGASPVSGKPASQVVVGFPSQHAQGEEGGDNLDNNNNSEVYSFDEKKDQAFEETQQTSEIKEENEPVPSNHTMLNPVSSGPVDMTYLPARGSPRRPPSPANSRSKRVVQQAGAALPSPSHHETPAGENHHQAQDAQDTNIPKRATVKDLWTKRVSGEGSFPSNQPQRGDSNRRPKDMPPLPGTPRAGAKPHPAVDLTLINQSSPRVAGDSPKVVGSSPRVAGDSPKVVGSSPHNSVRNRWLQQRENSDSGRQAGDLSEKDEEDEELAVINGGISTGAVPTTPRSEAAPVTPRTPRGGVTDRWTKRVQTSPRNNNIPSSPVILSSPGGKSDLSCRSSPFGGVRAQWAKRGNEQHPPALSIPTMKQEEEQEPVITVERSRNPESVRVPSPRLSMGKLWAKRHSTTESQGNEETGRDNASTDAPAHKQNPPPGDSGLRIASPSAGASKMVVRSPSSQLRRDALARRNFRAGVATRASTNSESDVAPRDDQLGSASKPVPSAASINPKIPISSPRSASNKSIDISNDGAVPSPQAGAPSRKMQYKKLAQKHIARPKLGMDSSEEDQQIREKSEPSARVGVSGPVSRDGLANSLPAPLSAVNKKRSNRNHDIQTNQQSVNVAKTSPRAATKKTSDAVSAPNTVASQRASPSNAPNRDTKLLLLDKHQQMVNTTGLVPDTIADDNSAGSGSETLSQTFYDIIAEDDQNQLSKQISSAAQRHPQEAGVPAKPSLNVQTLLAFGSEEDKTFDEDANPISPGTDCVGGPCSFDLPNTNSHSPTDTSKHAYEIGSDAGASRSSTGGNSLAARATRMMRTKHQSKTDGRQGHPSDATEIMRRPLVADQDTPQAGHRAQAKPTEIEPTEPKPYDPKPHEQEHHAQLRPDIEERTGLVPRSSAYETQSRFVDAPPSDTSTVSHTTGPSDAEPSDSVRGNFSFATETDESIGASVCVSEIDSRPDKGERRSVTPRAGRLDIVADEFVAESNSNANAFKNAYQSLSLEQITNDLKGVAGTLNIPGLDFSKLSTDLNKGMSAATESLNKLVGKDFHSPSKKGQLKIRTPNENFQSEERVAIEVEYVEDSDPE